MDVEKAMLAAGGEGVGRSPPRSKCVQKDEKGGDVLALCRDPSLSEVVLQVFDAAQGHDALPLGRAAAEWFLRLVRAVHVGVKGDLSPTFLTAGRGRVGGGGFGRRGAKGIHDREV